MYLNLFNVFGISVMKAIQILLSNTIATVLYVIFWIWTFNK